MQLDAHSELINSQLTIAGKMKEPGMAIGGETSWHVAVDQAISNFEFLIGQNIYCKDNFDEYNGIHVEINGIYKGVIGVTRKRYFMEVKNVVPISR